MLSREQPHRIHVAFDDQRLVAKAGLLLPVSLAHHLGLGELVDCQLDLGETPGRANAGDPACGGLTLVASRWPAATASTPTPRCVLGAPNGCWAVWSRRRPRWGPFLRSFRWGHVRQLDRVSRELLAEPGMLGRDLAMIR